MNCSLNKITGLALALIMISAGCTNSRGNDETVKGYNLAAPEKFFMPQSLFEISGIAFNKGRSDTVYAIQDEEGRLFRLGWGVKKQLNSKFAKKGDFEDLTIANDRIIILKSNGTMYSMPVSESVLPEADSVQEWKKILPKGEYESLFADEATENIYALCKNCPEDNSKKNVTGYKFQLDGLNTPPVTFRIKVKEIEALAGEVKRGFRPSGLARNPLTRNWYIISAVNKLLVVTDNNWHVLEAISLNGNMFAQPEGIAFDASGNLYISNEGDDFSEGNILKFKRLDK